MGNDFVRLFPDSTGKKVQTFVNTIGPNTVEAEAIVLVDPTGLSIIGTAAAPAAGVLGIQGVVDGTPMTTTPGPLGGVLSVNNSSSTPLLANAVFIGSPDDLLNTVSVDVNVLTDQASATNGLHFQWSQDGVVWNFDEYFSVLADIGAYFSLSPRGRYFRVAYTNGTTNQGTFRIVVYYYPVARSEFRQNINVNVPKSTAAEVVRTILAAQLPSGGDYTNLQATAGGHLLVDQGTPPWAVSQSGSWTTGRTWALTSGSDSVTTVPSGTQTVSGAVAVSSVAGPVAVTGTFWQATQPVSIAATINTSDAHTTAAAPLSTELSDGAAFYVAAKTGQLPVALDGSGFLKVHEQGTATISGTVTANAGTNLNTSALALDATLSTMSGKLPATLGAHVTAASMAVNIASDQTVPISAASLPLPAGASTSANQTTIGNQTTKINDGTNTAAVKAASAVIAATDPALVVGVSPNTPVGVSLADTGSVDAFGRLRVSEPVSLFNAQFQYDANSLVFVTSLSGTGSVTKTANETSITLSTGGTANGATAINQTKSYLRYQPGKSQHILMTGVLGAQKANVRSRIGYFDANDGLYFEMDGTNGAAVVQRSSTSGSPVNTVVLQASWNLDKMDGTGPSGVTVDFSKAQIFHIDAQWLGVGRVRFGFNINGKLYLAHQFLNANVITSPYMNTASLPCRAEITNTGVAGSTTTMKQICMSVASEGGTNTPSVLDFSASNGVTAISAGTTRTPIISIRPKTTFNSISNRFMINIQSVDIVNNGVQTIFFEVVYNGTLTGAAFADVDTTNSGVQKDVAASACTNGIVVASGYLGGGSRATVTIPANDVYPFTLDFAGTTPDIFSLCATSFGAGAATAAAFDWTENR